MSLPTAPSRTMDQDTFDTTTDAFIGALPQFEIDMNAASAAAVSSAASALSSENAASASATAASASATAAAVSAPMWASGSYNAGAVAWSPINFKTYRARTTGSKTTDPSLDPTNWTVPFNDVASSVNSKATAQAVHLTFAASGATGFAVTDNANLDMDTNDFGWHGMRVALPDYTPSAQVTLLHKHDATNGIIWTLETNGKLRLQINSTTYDSTVATGLEDASPALLGFSVGRSSASAAGEVRFYVNGEQIGDAVAIATGAPVTVANASTLYVMGTSAARMAGTVYALGALYNRKLSASEVRTRSMVGTLEADKWGKQTTSVVSAFSNNGTLPYDTFSGASATGFTAVTDGSAVAAANTADELVVSTLYLYLLTFNLTLNSGVAPNIRIYNNTSFGAVFSAAYPTVAGVNSILIAITTSGTGVLAFVHDAAAAGDYSVSNLSFRRAGAVADFGTAGIQPAQWHDGGSNELHAAFPTAGASLALFKETGQYNWTTPITGDTTLTGIVPAGYELDKIVFLNSTANAVDVRLGTTAGGTDVFGLTALNTSATLGGFKTIACNQAFSLTAAQTLYLSSTSWNSASLTATFYFRRVS